MKIFKYPLSGLIDQSIEMPAGAQVLTLQMQGGIPCLWALIDESMPKQERHFKVVGTGWLLDDDPGMYIGTFQDGSFVWHVFEVEEGH